MGLVSKSRRRYHDMVERKAAEAASEAIQKERDRVRAEQEALEERRRDEAPIIEELAHYSGKVILVANPGDLDPTYYHKPIATAIHNRLKGVKWINISLHAPNAPASAHKIDEASTVIGQQLSILRGGAVSLRPWLNFTPNGVFSAAMLEHVVSQTAEIADAHDIRDFAHVAITSSVGVEGLNLHRGLTRFGDTYLLHPPSAEGDLQWERIFGSPIGAAARSPYTQPS